MPTFLENCKSLGLVPTRAMENCYPEKCKGGCSDCNIIHNREEEGEESG